MQKSLLFLIAIICTATVYTEVYADYPDQPHTEYVMYKEKKILLKDGIDLSRGSFGKTNIHRSGKELSKVNFSNSNFRDADLRETNFMDCDFSNCYLYRTEFEGTVEGCNFSDSNISGASLGYGFTLSQLISTENYKKKAMWSNFKDSDFSGLDFSEFDLSGSSFFRCNLTDANFQDAKIANVGLDCSKISIDQLLETRDFKEGYVNSVDFNLVTKKGTPVNLSKMVFSHCKISSAIDSKIDLTDSVISGCDFSCFNGLTLENVKSTWNYKHGRMAGVKLPPEIQKTIDEEMKK